MPIYIFQHPKNNITIEIVQQMNDVHDYVDKKGVKWTRIFTVPSAQVNSLSKIDSRNAKEFADVTGKKSGTYGDLLDLSKELAAKRKEKEGTDTIGEDWRKNKDKKMDERKARNRARALERAKNKKTKQ